MAVEWKKIAYEAEVVTKSLFDANTILAATTDDTPAAVTIDEQRLVGRITDGNITALSPTQIATLLESGSIASPYTSNYLSLNGSGYASIADGSQSGLNMGLSDFMIEGWIKAGLAGDALQYLFTKRDAATFYITRLTSGFLEFLLFDGVNPQARCLGTTDLRDNKWHYVVFVVDRSIATGMRLYLDGSIHGGAGDPTSVGNLDNGGVFYASSYAGNVFFLGLVDELRVWNFGVDGLPADYAAYITWRYANPFTPTSEYDSGSWSGYVTNNLSAYWKFNGDYTDETSNGNDLTAGGSGNAFSVGTGTPAADRTIAIDVEGTTYYLIASTAAA